ncbi:hypothetical protein TRFO_11721 [Tritrichomonas foetus]|uniref:Nitroreductase domain-containing protein n=1 Tax=Tritrichomonas foetus TaxID=1144522 RepID=A0A1J4J7X0_9EUKA|nr:hypothetical protein TRFO_11721 [Tritrichomonas foetus]|eukprot:OHS93517.1 hypothetical protein TRFO_11721 [Tritrichomonas foetus]
MTKLNQAAIDGLGNPIIVQKILDTQKMGGYENITCYDCSALVFMVKDKERNTHPELTNLDAGIAAGMLMSAIAAYGLNSIPLGIFTNPKVDEVLGLESRSVLMAVAIGKAEGPIPPKVIKNNAKFIE